MAKNWRTAIIGCGVIGDWHLAVTKNMPNVMVAAVCDKDPAKAQKLFEKATLSGIPIYTDAAEMVANEQLDVVHVCTPSGNHLEPACCAMERGVNVICEKPMEITTARIDHMIECSKKHDVRLAGIFQNRWRPESLALRDAVRAGKFGTLAFGGTYTPWYRTDQYYRDGGWRGTWALDGGGAIMNQSVHGVDLIQWIMGPVKTVSAHGSSRIHPEIEVEDTLVASITFENGAHGVIMGSTAMYPGGAVRTEVGGADGTAVVEYDHVKLWKFRGEEKLTAEQAQDRIIGTRNNPATSGGGASATDIPHELHLRNISHILESWELGHDAETHGPEARKAVAIINALYDSMKQGGAVVAVK